MRQSPLALALIAALTTAGTASAHGDHEHDHGEFRQHGAHVHGVGQLDVVIDGDHLLMDLTIPGADVVGFEHPAATPEEEQAIAAALEQFRAAEELFLLPAAAECRLDIAEARVVQMDDHGHGHDDHEHHDEDHGHGHDHDDDHGHDHHDDDHAHDHGHDHDHSEFNVEYVFHCDAPERLDYIEVRVFEVFPDNETLQVQVVGPTGQTATELNAGHTRLSLNP